MDIDLIDQSIFMHRQLKSKMEEMGFIQEGKHYRHPDISYTVEFPSSPLAIGQELIKEEKIAHIETEYGVLRILAPTDSVKDRLAAYCHWKDERSLEQALLIANKHTIDMNDVRRWSIQEGNEAEFIVFAEKLSRLKR